MRLGIRETDEESKEAREKRQILFSSIARIDDLHLYSEKRRKMKKLKNLRMKFLKG